MFTASDRRSVPPSPASLEPRVHWGPTLSRRALLHGAWWPRSTDPSSEIPGLVHEVEERGGPVLCVTLGLTGWDERPTRLRVSGRTVRLGWFTTQPDHLLTASCGERQRIDLLVIPPDTDRAVAEAAMAMAVRGSNTVPAPGIVAAVLADQSVENDDAAETGWETEGGTLPHDGA